MKEQTHLKPQHIMQKSKSEFEFHRLATQITILDGRGRVVWRQCKTDESTPIRWFGVDSSGTPVTVGSYMCKILYSHNQQEVYLPFVFMC